MSPVCRAEGLAVGPRTGHDGAMADPKQTLTPEQIADAELTGWHQEGDTLTARFDTGDFAIGLAFVNRVGVSAEAANHHPDILLTYPQVTVTLSSHDVGGVTSRDLALAGTISTHAEELGIHPAEG